jgi:hypothetical protein
MVYGFVDGWNGRNDGKICAKVGSIEHEGTIRFSRAWDGLSV